MKTNNTVLIIDDDYALASALGRTMELNKYRVLIAHDGPAGKQYLTENSVQAMLLDVELPGQNGIEVLEDIRRLYPQLPVIMITAHGNVQCAVRALKSGAYDFLEKPIDRDVLLHTLFNAIDRSHLESERTGLLQTLQAQHEMIGNNKQIQKLKNAIELAAPTEEKVLILGETGTGKELVANSVYSRSRRASKPFIKVNCAAIPKDLIPSELFGHKKGSFTGAVDDREGKFKSADGGTIFLDEIGDMSLDVQSKVLRVLQEGEIEPVGGRGSEKVDVRVIAATNQNLEELTEEGRFRKDLYYRLKSIVLRVIPLRERTDDIAALIDYFLERAADRNNRPRLSLDENAIDRLLNYDWPGNVRELESLAAWLSVFATGPVITFNDINLWFEFEEKVSDPEDARADYVKAKTEFEREYFRKLLHAAGGNKSAAAKAAGLDRTGLYRKLKALGLEE